MVSDINYNNCLKAVFLEIRLHIYSTILDMISCPLLSFVLVATHLCT